MIKRNILILLGIAGIFFLYFYFTDNGEFIGELETEQTDSSTAAFVAPMAPKILFGITVDSMHIIEAKLKPNQSLSSILSIYNVSLEAIDKLAKRSREVFDLRKIAANKKFFLFCNKNSTNTAEYFVYEPNPYEYIVCSLKDSIQIVRKQKDIDTLSRNISGSINTSLYEAMIAEGATPELANRLSEIFGWQIDFFRIQKGDEFKVIFDEILVDNKAVGVGNIEGAFFKQMGEDYYAVAFDQGNGKEYFDDKGNSLRKAFLKAPLEFSRISSRYSLKRFHPVQKRFKPHLGTDYAAPKGTPIRTVGDGVILEAKYSPFNGNYVKVKHNSTYTTQYLHMSKIASGMRAGKKIRQGEIIGFVGSTGLATGPHLCFRFWKNGVQVDALREKIPSSGPVKSTLKTDYDLVKDKIIKKLQDIPKAKTEQIVLNSVQ